MLERVATSLAILGRRIGQANGPDLALFSHFAEKSSNFLKIEPAVHSPLSELFSNKPLNCFEINPQSTPPPTGHRRAPHEPPAARRDALPAAGPSSPGRESERAEGQRERRGAG